MQWDYLDDNTLIGVCEIDVGRKKMPKKFNIDLNISQIFNVKGKWNFAFSASKDEIMAKTMVFNPNTKIEFPNSKIVIEKVMFSPINTSIFIKGDYKDRNKFNHITAGIFDYDYWFVLNDKGRNLSNKGAAGGTAQGIFKTYDFEYKFDLESLKDIPKYLTVIPYERQKGNTKNQEIKKVIDDKYPIELNQGKIGSLIIKNIKYENDKTIIKYTANGKLPDFQASYLYIKDEKGEMIKPYNEFNKKRDENNPKEFTLEVPRLEKGKKYFLCTNILDNYQLKEDYMFKIPLE